MNCADKSARKTKIAQGKRRSSVNNYLKLNPNTRQRKESKKTQKRQSSRAESKARKYVTKTTTLFVIAKKM